MQRLLTPDSKQDGSREADAQAIVRSFTDDAGDTRPVDRTLLAHLLGCSAGDPPPNPAPDELAWWCCHSRKAVDRLPIDWNAAGRLFPSLHEVAIEIWTDAELSSVHALSWDGLRGRNDGVLTRLVRAAEWLLAEVQPDNATERPWAVHVFAAMSLDPARSPNARAEADLYAQTLLQNALVGRDKADRFSACILWDAADWLDAAGRVTWQDGPALLAPMSRPS